jgi:hypothetical protein
MNVWLIGHSQAIPERTNVIALGMDDYVLRAVLRRGPIVSTPDGPQYVRVHDLSEDAEGRHPIFRMSVLEASMLVDKYPEFEERGLAGTFKMAAPNGLLKLMAPFDHKGDQEALKAFLTDPASAEFLRSRYVTTMS